MIFAKRILASSLAIGLSTPVLADINEAHIQVDDIANPQLCSDWRVANTARTKWFGCNGEISRDQWNSAACSVVLRPGNYVFELRTGNGEVDLDVSAQGIPTIEDHPMMNIGIIDQEAFLTFNNAQVPIIANGYEGYFSIEGQSRQGLERCPYSPAIIPLGTTPSLHIGSSSSVRFHMALNSKPFPTGTSGVVQAGNTSLSLQTMNVTIIPQNGGLWQLTGAAQETGSTYFEGAQTIRLVRDTVYQMVAHAPRTPNKSNSTYFRLPEDCRVPVGSVYVQSAGEFLIEQSCHVVPVPLSHEN